MAARTVTYRVRFDEDAGVWFGEREGERTWNMYAEYDVRGKGRGDPIPVTLEGPDDRESKTELVRAITGYAFFERNRSGGGTGRGYGTKVVVHGKRGGRSVTKIPVITRCSSKPFRRRR